ncbi:MAG TPA: Fe-S cluster assembly protein SufD [Capsulimonadaceae bacterium]|jgi:Fe-S cluster assembly protein SufD
MTQTLETTGNYAEDFEALDAVRAVVAPKWLTSLRRRSIAAFTEAGLPTRRHEEWRYTPIPRVVETPFKLAGYGVSATPHLHDVIDYTFGDLKAHQLVFIDGKFAPTLSTILPLPSGVRIGSLAELLQEDPLAVEGKLGGIAEVDGLAFPALNTAFFHDGAYVLLPKNAVVDEPIHILYLSSGGAEAAVTYPRTLVVAGESSQAMVVESFAGSSGELYFTNAVTEFYIAANANIEHNKLTREGAQAQHIATTQIDIERSATFTSHNITLGGLLVRNNFNAHLGGEGIVCTLNGLYMGRDKQLVDNHTFIDHAQPHCESHEIYKGILDGQSRGVFNGKIMVRPDAQKTDAKQTNKTLLLSKEATIDTKPQLEIFADDVRCTHGATVGQSDEEAIFYLRTRGIGEADARSLMVYAFAADIVNRITIEPVRRRLDEALFTEGALQGIAR